MNAGAGRAGYAVALTAWSWVADLEVDAPELDRSRAVWRTSSYSDNGGACVEVADNMPGIVAVRDSKDRNGSVLVLTSVQWTEFTAGVRAGEFSAD